jgi:hypothetical protein
MQIVNKATASHHISEGVEEGSVPMRKCSHRMQADVSYANPNTFPEQMIERLVVPVVVLHPILKAPATKFQEIAPRKR